MDTNQSENLQKTFVITGAAEGLGWAITLCLAKKYRAEFVLVDISAEKLRQREAQLRAIGVRVRIYTVDLSNCLALEELAQSLRNEHSRVDLLVNNAGITHRSLSTQTSSAVIRKVMAVNYHVPVELTQGLFTELKAASGCVVNISSMAGWMPVLGRAGYCAAKSALHQYFEVFREEVRNDGVSVLMVYPSFLATTIEQNALAGDGGQARHQRSTVGAVRSPEWMANQIMTALEKGRERWFPKDISLIGAYLYRLAPMTFLKQLRRRFRMELGSTP
ncbi:putative oxidoreductase EphD [Microbulbifer sp. NBRC 101763]|uniref:SDR family NAD(P)-dependent oxidoreductase n=1 Tax=Microbulbifer TaxID=48073 RepID=UPI00036DB09C|nr:MULTISPECIES: SDR family NAD(P)-dependent oxidoreductase [Microbulbifer]WHI53326.1 SDR family NAD(P)-dependent oxidoreductase [Microbulbifer sp. MLAF003]